jgi:hypothetical protein
MLIACAVVWAEAASGAAQTPVHLDGVAALVGGNVPAPGVDVILRSDVELAARLSLLERSADPPSGPIVAGLLSATLDRLLGEHVIAREARRLQVVRADASDVARETERLVRAVGGAQRLQALLLTAGVDRAELDAIAQRRALVAAFLNANLQRPGASAGDELERWVHLLRARTPLRIYARYE